MGRGIELEWTIIDDDEGWSQKQAHPPSKPRRWRAIAAVALVLIALVGAAIILARHRLEQQQRQLNAQFQALIDLERHAIANGDSELYLSLLDRRERVWFRSQQNTFEALAGDPQAWPQLHVTQVEWVDDYAWVNVALTLGQDGERFTWIRFFRWTGDNWRLTAPDPNYWGETRTQIVGPLHFVYHERDERYVEPIASELTDWLASLCADLDCPDDLALIVRLTLPFPHHRALSTRPDVIELPSPAAWPQPAHGPPNIPSVDFLSDTIAQYIAFESAGGREHWTYQAEGAWLVHAAAQWALERAAPGLEASRWRFQAEQGRGVLRLAVRNGHLTPLKDLWRSDSFPHTSYATAIDFSAHTVDLDSAKARAVIDYVAQVYDQAAVSRLVQTIGDNDALDAALQEALGVHLLEFETDWHTWLATHYGFGKGL